MTIPNRKVKSDKPPVFIVTPDSTTAYGSSRSLLSIIKYLNQEGYPLSVFCFTPGFIYEEIKCMEIPVATFTYTWHKKSNKLIQIFFFIYQKLICLGLLVRGIISTKAQIVYINTIYFSLPSLAGAICGKRVVIHVRDSMDYLLGKKLYQKAKRAVFKNCTSLFICISKHTEAMIQKILKSVPSEVVYNGLDLEEYNYSPELRKQSRKQLAISDEDFLIVSVNRIDPNKGIIDLLDALEKCRGIITNLKVIIVGGPLDSRYFFEEIQPRLKRWHNVVHFEGYQKNVIPYLAAADLFVNTTYDEQFGRSNLEAMSMKRCVLTTNVGGIPEIVIDNESGVLVPPSNSSILAEKILFLYENKNERCRLGYNAISRVEKYFSQENSIKRATELIYNN